MEGSQQQGDGQQQDAPPGFQAGFTYHMPGQQLLAPMQIDTFQFPPQQQVYTQQLLSLPTSLPTSLPQGQQVQLQPQLAQQEPQLAPQWELKQTIPRAGPSAQGPASRSRGSSQGQASTLGKRSQSAAAQQPHKATTQARQPSLSPPSRLQAVSGPGSLPAPSEPETITAYATKPDGTQVQLVLQRVVSDSAIGSAGTPGRQTPQQGGAAPASKQQRTSSSVQYDAQGTAAGLQAWGGGLATTYLPQQGYDTAAPLALAAPQQVPSGGAGSGPGTAHPQLAAEPVVSWQYQQSQPAAVPSASTTPPRAPAPAPAAAASFPAAPGSSLPAPSWPVGSLCLSTTGSLELIPLAAFTMPGSNIPYMALPQLANQVLSTPQGAFQLVPVAAAAASAPAAATPAATPVRPAPQQPPPPGPAAAVPAPAAGAVQASITPVQSAGVGELCYAVLPDGRQVLIQRVPDNPSPGSQPAPSAAQPLPGQAAMHGSTQGPTPGTATPQRAQINRGQGASAGAAAGAPATDLAAAAAGVAAGPAAAEAAAHQAPANPAASSEHTLTFQTWQGTATAAGQGE